MKPTDEAVWYVTPKAPQKLLKLWWQMLCITDICKSVGFSVILVYFMGRAKISSYSIMKQTVCDFQLHTAEWSQHGSSSAPAIAMWESVIHSHLFCRLCFAAVGHFMHLTCSLHKKLSIHKNVGWIRLQCKLNPAHAVCIMMYIIIRS